MTSARNRGASLRQICARAAVLAALVLTSMTLALPPRQGRADPAETRGGSAIPPRGSFTLPRLRRALSTTIGRNQSDRRPVPRPPAGVLERVTYKAPLGANAAYVTPVRPGKRGPAIVWIVGGFGSGIDEGFWEDAPPDNDQTAAAFRKAGIAEMFPALRGASGNAGHHECFLGEIDDILAAADFLAKRPDVDPARIYLGGHSTGGTMVLLAAESTARFRAVFAFGPVPDPRRYGRNGCLPADVPDDEARPRAPVGFIAEIVSPTFIIEGLRRGNAGAFPLLRRRAGTAPITFIGVPDGTHFTVLGPGCAVIARAILADTGPTPKLQITADDINRQMLTPGR
jgi:acetyl esterase/lipase